MTQRLQNFSTASERNKAAILAELQHLLPVSARVLEVGSGSGQHALHFAGALPGLTWQSSELPANLPALRENLENWGGGNLEPPLALDVHDPQWPVAKAEVVYSANTLHIMGWEEVEAFFERVGEVLNRPGLLCIYGPFRYRGGYTSASNAEFDRWLRARDPASGIRDFEAVDRLAAAKGLALWQDIAMPANNQLLVWRR